jgi:hypothetical protein
MRATIIQPNGNLEREVWEFDLETGFEPHLRLMSFAFQTRPSTRHKKWINQNRWDRLDRRNNTITSPPYSAQVVNNAKEYFINYIRTTEVIT